MVALLHGCSATRLTILTYFAPVSEYLKSFMFTSFPRLVKMEDSNSCPDPKALEHAIQLVTLKGLGCISGV